MAMPMNSHPHLSPPPPPPPDFEFSISLSPSSTKATTLSPADELFYKGQLLPLNLPPRFQMVQTILAHSNSSKLASDSYASIDLLSSTIHNRDSFSETSTSRDSNGSSDSSCFSAIAELDSSRPSSATEDERTKTHFSSLRKLKNRFTSVFRSKNRDAKIKSKSAKEVFQMYVKKVKPLYEKISQKHEHQHQQKLPFSGKTEQGCRGYSHSFSGNLHFPINGRKKRGFNGFSVTGSSSSMIGSCPSSMRSSPSHSGVLYGRPNSKSMDSTMEELQNAIQGAIAHCKNSIKQSQG